MEPLSSSIMERGALDALERLSRVLAIGVVSLVIVALWAGSVAINRIEKQSEQ